MKSMNFIGRNLVCIFICLFLFACGGGKTIKKESEASETSSISGLENLNEDFDPLLLSEPPLPIRPKPTQKQESHTATAANENKNDEIPKEIIGYRIQIFQTEDIREAREFQKDTLVRLDIDAYISYDNPYYKVRIGDFSSRYEAEDYLLTLESKGYKGAWIVRTLIVNRAYTESVKQEGVN